MSAGQKKMFKQVSLDLKMWTILQRRSMDC